jgi:hypothetical protein
MGQLRLLLRVVLRLTAPELAALPWETLFDPETGAYLCRREPLVRHVPAPYTADPVEVRPLLRHPLGRSREQAHGLRWS